MLKAPLLTAALCGLAGAAGAAPLLPDLSAAEFPDAAPINPYFPLIAGQHRVIAAEGVDDEGEPFTERSELTTLDTGPEILGVQTTTVRDRAFENGVLVEDTFDYFATDSTGNVWYFGEDVTNYVYDDAGKLIGTNNQSAWIAGENGARPGWIMPAAPLLALNYYQEFATADAALDEGTIYALGETLDIPGFDLFEDVLITHEGTALDPDARELNYYAPGFGLIRVDEGLDENFANAEVVFELQPPAAVPLPASLPLAVLGFGSLALLSRRRG